LGNKLLGPSINIELCGNTLIEVKKCEDVKNHFTRLIVVVGDFQ